MSSLLGVLLLTSTVFAALALGILSAYVAVIGILQSFASASKSKPTNTRPVLASGQARAAHAGGD